MTEKPIDKEALQRNFQAKVQKLLELQKEAEYYQSVLENTTILLSEVLRTKKILKEIQEGEKKSIEGLINLGVGVFAPGTIEFGDKVLVDIGSSIGVWMGVQEAVERLEKHEEKIKETIQKTNANLNEINKMLTKLQTEIEQIRSYMEGQVKK